MKVKCFGIAKDICKTADLNIEQSVNPANVQELRNYLEQAFPAFGNINSCMIAVNQEYAENDQVIHSSDEIAIIPPVSGG